MPFGMGPGGWYALPYMASWLRYWYPWLAVPFWPPFHPFTKEQEIDMLEEQAKALEEQLNQIRMRMKELKKTKKEVK
jgi:hypothetical protein